MVTNKYVRKEIEQYKPKEPVTGNSIKLAKNMAKTSNWHIDKACAFVARMIGSENVSDIGPRWIKPGSNVFIWEDVPPSSWLHSTQKREHLDHD